MTNQPEHQLHIGETLMEKILHILYRIYNGETTLHAGGPSEMVRFQVDVVCLQQAHKLGYIAQPWFMASASMQHPWQIEKVSMLKLTDLGIKTLQEQYLGNTMAA